MSPRVPRPGVPPERWARLTLDDKIGNLGTDVARAVRARIVGDEARLETWLAVVRAEFVMTLADPRWLDEKSEIARQQGLVEDFLVGNNLAASTPESLDAYFVPFAVRSNEARAEQHHATQATRRHLPPCPDRHAGGGVSFRRAGNASRGAPDARRVRWSGGCSPA